MKENRLLWSQTDLPFNPASLWYLDGGGLFLLSGLGTQQKVTAVEEETGALGAVLLDIWTDTDLGRTSPSIEAAALESAAADEFA